MNGYNFANNINGIIFLKYLEGLPPLHGWGTPFIRRPFLRALKGNITIVQNAIFSSKTSNRISVWGGLTFKQSIQI